MWQWQAEYVEAGTPERGGTGGDLGVTARSEILRLYLFQAW